MAFICSQPKKPQGPVTLLKVTNLACSRSLSRSWVDLRGLRALGHVFGKRFLENRYECDVRAKCGMISFVSTIYRDTRSAVRGGAGVICDPILFSDGTAKEL